ncbi:uncharacterized protein [Asterias amurensis]|uniref:uncharacterized protein n=1 Tax=Asterias amurensis TaxID=7602 RepID=UPI003AB48BA1
MTKSKIPNRWECYASLGKCISGTRLLAFKVPLKQELCRNLKPHERFTPENLIERVSVSGQPLGLVIDLTNTSRYYNPQEIERAGIEYYKLNTEGHIIPAERIVQRFTRIVQDFTRNHSNNGFCIGVHCTHGINRTGYLICRYMVENLGFTSSDALIAFADARGHKVERQNYIDDLHRISGAKQTSYRARSRVMHFGESSSLASQDIERSNHTTTQCASNPIQVNTNPNGSSSQIESQRRKRPHSQTASTKREVDICKPKLGRHIRFTSDSSDDCVPHDIEHQHLPVFSHAKIDSYHNAYQATNYTSRDVSYRQYNRQPFDNGQYAVQSDWRSRQTHQSSQFSYQDYDSYRTPMSYYHKSNKPKNKPKKHKQQK